MLGIAIRDSIVKRRWKGRDNALGLWSETVGPGGNMQGSCEPLTPVAPSRYWILLVLREDRGCAGPSPRSNSARSSVGRRCWAQRGEGCVQIWTGRIAYYGDVVLNREPNWDKVERREAIRDLLLHSLF
ncbi:uncharacterized protein CIMG_13386 [Coccidioides immitis RS]|uniref:Uncharacterized protein n=1 Tax=Coccidioides immitis (strain RS) TaxID=246410 RepID=A0A0D8JUR0_COCIM|nr:uncharacterized protein CIMG_13386 [Coccidioides immitis RS]KJF61042.1 hypothetical protein CIMG_13386 [Coccidioides immitis RS]